MKSEPEVFSFNELLAAPQKTTYWEGVRNYQARNMMRDAMAVGDEVLFYHSNCAEPGVVGLAEVVRAGYPDHTAWDPKSRYFDPKCDAANPRWFMVDIRGTRALRRTLSLAELKARDDLEGFPLVRKGNRLSVMPVDAAHWEVIVGSE